MAFSDPVHLTIDNFRENRTLLDLPLGILDDVLGVDEEEVDEALYLLPFLDTWTQPATAI